MATPGASLETLPIELVLCICKRLSLRDCCRFCSISRRYNAFLPDIVSSLQIKELVVQEPDLLDVSFIQRYLCKDIVRIVIIVETLTEQLVDYVESLFRICVHAETLDVKTSFKFHKSNGNAKLRPTLGKLVTLISSLNLREINVEPRLRKFILPLPVRRCVVDSYFLRQFADPAFLPHYPIVHPDPSLFHHLTTMTVMIYGNCHRFWKSISLFTSLRDLTFRGNRFVSCLPEAVFSVAVPRTLQSLTMDFELGTRGLEFISHLPVLKVLTLTKLEVNFLDNYAEIAGRPIFDDMDSLQELHIGGNTVVDECRLYSWLLASGCLRITSLERIFVHFNPVNWLGTLYQTPALEEKDLTKFRAGVLQNLFFFIEDKRSWKNIYQYLHSLDYLNELWLFFCMENVSLKNAIEASFEAGCVQTRISRLMIADNYSYRRDLASPVYPFHECSFRILACFPNVGVYKLHTSAVILANSPDAMRSISLWKERRIPSSALSLYFCWFQNPPYNQLKLVESALTNLVIVVRGSSSVNLENLRECAKNLEELEIEITSPTRGGGLGFNHLPALLSFKRLKRVTITASPWQVKSIQEGFAQIKPQFENPPSCLERILIRWSCPGRKGSGTEWCTGIDGFEKIELFLTHFGVKEHRR